MPLVACPDCAREHSDAAASCPQCGRPNGAVAVMERPAIPVVPIAPGPRSAHACPRCGSENARKLSLVFRDGMQLTQSATGGVIVGRGGVAGVGAVSAGTAQSLSSASAAPPVQKKANGLLVAMLALGTFMVIACLGNGSPGWAFVGLLMTIPGGMAIYNTGKWNKEQFPGLYAHWDATFQCDRCENRYVPAA